MKIISKFKDYYDYLVGIYGEDPLIILDRRECMNTKQCVSYHSRENKKITLFVGGNKIEGIVFGTNSKHYNNSRVYYGEELKKFSRKEDNKGTFVYIGDLWVSCYIEKDINNYNEKQNCPILYSESFSSRGYGYDFQKYPILQELNLGAFFEPKEIYNMIYSWLSEQKTKKENHIDNRTDVQKLESFGFDKSVSFRGKN